MKIQIFALLAVAMSALMTSCYYPPYEPQQPLQKPVVPSEQQVLTDTPANSELEQQRQHLQNQGLNDPTAGTLPTPSPTTPTTSGAYPTASSVPNKPGFVLNPYTGNQVDARGVPSRSLIKDPNDPDPTHKFRVP